MSETYTGRGTLTVNGEDHPCAYHLDIYEDRRLKSGSGAIETAPSAIWAAFTAGKAVVTMEDGRTFPVIVDGPTNGGTASFKLAGAISAPGA